jgi:hypothetical protein
MTIHSKYLLLALGGFPLAALLMLPLDGSALAGVKLLAVSSYLCLIVMVFSGTGKDEQSSTGRRPSTSTPQSINPQFYSLLAADMTDQESTFWRSLRTYSQQSEWENMCERVRYSEQSYLYSKKYRSQFSAEVAEGRLALILTEQERLVTLVYDRSWDRPDITSIS